MPKSKITTISFSQKIIPNVGVIRIGNYTNLFVKLKFYCQLIIAKK